MEITINIEDYVTPENIKDEAMYVIRSELARQYHNNESEINRLIANLSYEFVFKAVSDAIGESAEKKIADAVANLLEDESHIRYLMWRRKDAWDKTESPAIGIMERAIKDNEGLIRTKVMQAIDGFEFDDVKTAIYEALDGIIYDKVSGKEGS